MLPSIQGSSRRAAFGSRVLLSRLNSTAATPNHHPRHNLPPHIESRIGKSKPARLGTKREERVAFQIGDGGISNERREFFTQIDEGGFGDPEAEEVVAGLEPGRVVECRRYVYRKRES